MKRKYLLSTAVTLILLTACTTKVPTEYANVEKTPAIYPNYIGVTIPCNIAPLNFMYTAKDVTNAVTVFTCGEESVTLSGVKVMWDLKKWHSFLAKSQGKSINVTSYVKTSEWSKYRSFRIDVVNDPVDPYITYRLIAPSYVTYEDLTINQRCLEDFNEDVIFCNMMISTEDNGQCINCHCCRNNNPDSLQFHARQHKGGTIMAFNGDIQKINLKTDSTLSAGVYPAWHPTHNYIAYSVNNTGQSFHTRDTEKIEVQDISSDLILYDIGLNEVTRVETDTTEWECFPCWSPDGRWLYYVSAHYEATQFSIREREIIDRYQEFKYNLYRKSFDPATKHFGEKELVYDAAAKNKSVTLPRVSPDGRYLLMTIGDYGVFHIWHHSADLLLLDLKTNSMRLLSEANSPNTESFHNWSTNGRWILFSSRRDDGSYTRLYLSYFDRNGKAHKPFIVPQKDPNFYNEFYRSYNIPEFMTGPVTIDPHEFAAAINEPAIGAVYHEQY